MTVRVRQFDRDKALEAVLFIAQNLNKPSLHSVSKMFYLADKRHLQEYGRMICGDRYVAMDYGPVPSAIYDMMKVPDGRASIDVDWDALIKEAFAVLMGRNIAPKREADTYLLAESEIECIMAAIHEHGMKSFGQLSDLTHDAAWSAVAENQTIPLDEIVRTLPNAEEVLSYLHAH